jgi:hypothetical protein
MSFLRTAPLMFLLLVALATLSSSGAIAADPGTTIQLVATYAEPSAGGQATLTRVRLSRVQLGDGWKWWTYKGYLTATCQGLTPGTSYEVHVEPVITEYERPLQTVVADDNGESIVEGQVRWDLVSSWLAPLPGQPGICVLRVNADGSRTRVLQGLLPWSLFPQVPH